MKRVYILFVLLFVVTSCVQENLFSNLFEDRHSFELEAVLEPIDNEIELDVEIDDKIDTKAYAASFSSPMWAEGDKVSVVNITTEKVLGGQLSTNSSGYIVKFNGTVTGTINVGDSLVFLYPALDNSTEIDYVPQSYDISEQDGGTQVKMIAGSESVALSADNQFVGMSLNFKYFMSYLKLNFANLPVSTSATSIVINNVNDIMTLNINDAKNALEPECVQDKGKITVTGGTYNVSASGTASCRVAVFPSSAVESRDIHVFIDDKEYSANFSAAQLASNRYYNTIVSNFREVIPPTDDGYGIYRADGTDLFVSEMTRDQFIITYDGDKTDFAIVNPVTHSFVKIYSVPVDLTVGSQFSSLVISNGIENLSDYTQETFSVEDKAIIGDYTKYWLRSANYQFILKK